MSKHLVRDFGLAIFFVVMLFVPLVKSEQTQQFNKIMLEPFYRIEMQQDTDYTYTLEVNAPDDIENVKSAIVTFQMWLNPTIEFFLTVNGETCNTASYEVHTTYAGAGEGTIFFDCSNVITGEGTYDIVLTPDDDTGAVTAWIDMVYMNDPKGEVEVFGTEYIAGDRGTVFLQLTDNQGLGINSGSCLLDIYQPSVTNLSHAQVVFDAPMIYKTDSDALYYYDYVLPDTEGVYMLSATCTYSNLDIFVYAIDVSETDSSTRNVTTGVYNGNTLFLNDFKDNIYTSCDSANQGGTQTCDAYYDFNTTGENLENATVFELFYSGEADKTATAELSVWNWTDSSWIVLPNILTFTGQAGSGPIGVGEFASNSLPVDDTLSVDNIIRIRSYITNGPSFHAYENWLNIRALTAEGIPHQLKGSGELHISNLYGQLNDSINNIDINASEIAQEVWSYNGTINSNILNQFAGAFWNWTGSISATIGNFFSNAVWSASDRNLTFYPDTTNVSEIWNYENRTITDTAQSWVGGTEYDIQEGVGKIVLRLVGGSGEPVEGADCKASIFYPNNTRYITDGNMTEVVVGVPPINATHAGAYLFDFNLSQEIGVHPYAIDCNRLGQDYFFLDTFHVRDIAEEVWENDNRTLSEFPNLNVTALGGNVNATIIGNVNSTPSEVFIGGTEYIQGEGGKIVVRLIRNQGGGAVAELGASCEVTILYPNETVLDFANMSEYGQGIYTHDFTTDNSNGIFTYFTDCSSLSGGRDYFSLNTFHIGLVDGIETNVVNVTNTTVNSQIVNVTNQSVNVNNQIVNLTNQTVNVNNQIVNLTNQTVQVNNQIVNLSNFTVDTTILNIDNITTIVNLTNASIDADAIANAVWNYNGTISDNIINQFVTEIECVLNRLIGGEEGWGVNLVSC